MKNKSAYLLVLLFIVCILIFPTISATESTVNDFINDDTNNKENNLETNIQCDVVSNSKENIELKEEKEEENYNNDELSESGTEKTSTDNNDYLTFTDLNTTINNNTNSTVSLSNNYKFNNDLDSNFKDGIIISRNLTIYGNGVTLDGNDMARIFNVTDSNLNINFYNINFINANTIGYGGAIIGGNAYNCTFTDNYGDRGGAIYNGTAYNCTFTHNSAEFGGAIYNGNAYNCTFTDNIAINDGGAMSNSNAYNCTFTDNKAQGDGGAIISGNAYNCTFTDNNVIYNGGSIYNGNAYNCIFTDGYADKGGAIYNGDGHNCIFTNNDAGDGGAIYKGNAYNCTFTNNNAINGQAMYEGNAILCIFNNDTTFNTKIIPAKINVLNYTSTYKSGKKLKFTLIANDTTLNGYNITIKIYKDSSLVKTVYALSGKGWIVDLKQGTYKAVLSLTDYPDEKPAKATITVKEKTKITAKAVSTIYNVDKNLIITLKDQNNKPLKGATLAVKLGSTKKYKTDKNGQIKINIATLTPKTYNVKIAYNGSKIYNGSTSSVKVTVKKATPKITVKKANFKATVKTKKYTATFKNNKNQALKNTKVTLKVLGKTYTAKTNNKGQATFKITNLNKKRVYTAAITYPGNKYYNKVSTIGIILVK